MTIKLLAKKKSMKKYIVVYSSFTLLFYCLLKAYFYFTLSHHPSKEQQATISSPTIVVPAIIDSLADVTRIPALESGVLKAIHVSVGQKLKQGQALFSLEDTRATYALTMRKLEGEQARNNLLMQQKALTYAQKQLGQWKKVDERAISKAELHAKIHEVNTLKMNIKQAQYNVDLSEANLKNAELTLIHHTSRAPKDGIVLQINAHVNEFVGATQTIILLGDAEQVIVRASLDERDSLQFNPKNEAYLTSDLDTSLKIPLKFMQLDQFITKQERLNSRVREVLYYFNREAYPKLVAGQQADVTLLLSPTT